MTTYHTYASVEFFRDTLAGTSYSATWTADSGLILAVLERASRAVDAHVGDQTFGPVTQTRLYDLGGSGYPKQYLGIASGDLRYDPRALSRSVGIATVEYRGSVVPLDRWLITATTVTSYADTARTLSGTQTLVEGIANDYLLEPYNSSPKWRIKLNENTAKSLGSGQQVFSILGSWGWDSVTVQDTTLSAAITSTTATTCTVASAAAPSVGQTILIDSEQLYISGISSTTLTVVRGVNGTTAATHLDSAPVLGIRYPSDVQSVTADIARVLYRGRDLGIVDAIGGGEQGIRTRPAAEIASALAALDHYTTARHAAGLVF
ncbi:MAG: hypothetical protein O3A25_19110 [Acidobacteria bacterium]|nr:hypothetical protein [Acidobacteriota bacterium]